METDNFYERLGVNENATEEDIKKSFRKLCLIYHPDKTKNDKEKENYFKIIKEAYETLIDNEKRYQYDMIISVKMSDIKERANKLFTENLDDLLNNTYQNKIKQECKIIKKELLLDKTEYEKGCIKKVDIEDIKHCQECNGIGINNDDILICFTCKGQKTVKNETCGSCNGIGYYKTSKTQRTCEICNGMKQIKNIYTIDVSLSPYCNTKDKYIYYINNNKIKVIITISIKKQILYIADITIQELFTGFIKNIILDNKKYILKSNHYFNPKKEKVFDNIVIKFNITYPNEENDFIKLVPVFKKIFKFKNTEYLLDNYETLKIN